MSTKTVTEKLYIKPGKTSSFLNPPANNDDLPDSIPKNIVISEGDPADVLLACIDNRTPMKQNYGT